MSHTRPLLLNSRKACDNATTFDIKLPRVPEGERWRFDHVATVDETTAATTVRVGILRQNDFSPLLEQASPGAATLYHSEEPFYLEEGDELMARWSAATLQDQIALYANGIAERKEPSNG